MSLDNNQFIFVVKNPIKITIVCKDTVTHDWLVGEGMLSLQSQCVISNENMQLNSKTSFGNVSELIVPNLNIVKDWALSYSANREYDLKELELGKANFTELERKLNETRINLKLIKKVDILTFIILEIIHCLQLCSFLLYLSLYLRKRLQASLRK